MEERDAVVDGTEPTVIYSGGKRIGFLELNRPDKRNALSAELLADFNRALDGFEADEAARVAILKGRGRSFCAGFDLGSGSASTAPTTADPWKDRGRLLGWMKLALRLWESPRPIIAQIHGHCLAGGILLPLSSDLMFVAEDCVLGWPRLPVGAGFMDGAMSILIGQRRAKEISYVVGSRITGTEAAEWGFANRAFPSGELEDQTVAFATKVAKTPRNVLEIRKAAMIRASSGLTFREALLAGVEWDAIAHADHEVDAMRTLVRENGMSATIDAFENTDDPYRALGAER
jgi:enoyl-CoA hydratase